MANLRRVAPELPVQDLASALEYYTGRPGFEVGAIMPSRNSAIVERDDVSFHLFVASAGTCVPVAVHVFATDLETLHAELESRARSSRKASWCSRGVRATFEWPIRLETSSSSRKPDRVWTNQRVRVVVGAVPSNKGIKLTGALARSARRHGVRPAYPRCSADR